LGDIITILLLFILSFHLSAQQDCSDPFSSHTPILLSGPWAHFQTNQDVETHFTQLLSQGKRLEYRGMRQGDQYLLPIVSINRSGLERPALWINLPEHLIQSVIKHIQLAIDNGYAQFPFFPDMGHGHLHLPPGSPGSERNGRMPHEFLSDEFNDPNLALLYHSAEAYDLTHSSSEDWSHIWLHRNFVGRMDKDGPLEVLQGPLQGMNTLGSIPGMVKGSTIYFSASRQGCIPFEFQGESLFLDFSMHGHTVRHRPQTSSSTSR
jgi:hypothetical protein